jgi:hypothetical protein
VCIVNESNQNLEEDRERKFGDEGSEITPDGWKNNLLLRDVETYRTGISLKHDLI